MLGIPSVRDRLIQQALHQILSPLFEETFSTHSYGFRPGRSAAQAIQQSRRYIEEGRRWVVDADLEKFFDRVNHDILMSRVARKVKDKRVLASMTRFLESRLKLRVNRGKSAVDRPWKRSFLGYTVCNRKYNVRLKVAPKSI
ncbi:MAG: reverse transcriptase domain-containing protein [Gammaproteobacteria bacterium]|nr:reverse transcriptase domain-containing protein [Gammaproteobacteria bacterium]